MYSIEVFFLQCFSVCCLEVREPYLIQAAFVSENLQSECLTVYCDAYQACCLKNDMREYYPSSKHASDNLRWELQTDGD